MFPSPSSWKIVRGDLVQIMTGKDKGKQGTVLRVIRDQRFPRVFVSGLNLMTRRVPKRTSVTGQHLPGFSVRMEAPLHYSNVMLVDPIRKIPVRVKIQYEDKWPFNRVRMARSKRSSQTLIPWPQAWKQDLTPPAAVGEKDTRLEVVDEVTYDAATDFTMQLPSAHRQKKRVKDQQAAAAAERKAAQHKLYKKYRPLLFSKAAGAGEPGSSSSSIEQGQADSSSSSSSSSGVSTTPGSSVRSYCSSSSCEAAGSNAATGAVGALRLLQLCRPGSSSSRRLLGLPGSRLQQHMQRLSWCGLSAAPLLLQLV